MWWRRAAALALAAGAVGLWLRASARRRNEPGRSVARRLFSLVDM